MNTTSAPSLEVANTILAQLGGRRFLMMTGARNLTADVNSLKFRLPTRLAKDGINCVKVTLDPSDTYTVTFYKIGRAPKFEVTVVYETNDIYCDSLVELFERKTGVYTHL
jgi:hypothetical protein